MFLLLRRLVLLPGIVSVLFAAAGGLAAQEPAAPSKPATGSLDAFMEQVLARREVNRKTLNDYILDETETFEILGPGRYRLHRSNREFTWYVRDGIHVRSPVKFDGVTVGAKAREDYEADWIRRERERAERKAKNKKEKGQVSIGSAGVRVDSGAAAIPTEPRFVSEAYFMDFKFEPGNYYLAGREQLEGHDVLRIEYYPTHLFDDEDKKTPKEIKERDRDQRRDDKMEQDIERKMNKTALVTLWVDPTEHQIVKYTFDNVWLDFLPGAWLVRVDDIRASMTMGQPFPGVWLPREMNIHAGVTLANGSFEASYGRTFDQYREAQIKTTIRVPKIGGILSPAPERPDEPMRESDVNDDTPWPDTSESDDDDAAAPVAEPFVEPGESAQQEIVREVRVHGNASLTDEEVLKLAGIELNAPLASGAVTAIEQRLEASHRFETVEVRKRMRSLDDPTDVALVLVVHERPGVRSGSVDTPPVFRPLARLRSQLMFLPILNYADGYGFTYGGRVSTVDYLGFNERLSVPLSWGGLRRAAIEFERDFKSGPLTQVTSSFGIWNRRNPRYDIRDQRVELKAGAERDFAHVVRLGVDASRSSVSFGTIDSRIWTLGATAALDTRSDPAFPGQRRVPRRRMEWTAREGSPADQSLHARRARLPAPLRTSRAGRARPVLQLRRRASRLRTAPAGRRLHTAGLSHRDVRRRPDDGDLCRSACARHVGDQQRKAGRARVRRRRARHGCRTKPEGRPVATRRRRRHLHPRADGHHQPWRRPRPRRRRNARVPLVGILVLSAGSGIASGPHGPR